MLQKQRLLTPGPTPIPERVRLVMAQDMIHHRKPEFKKAMARVQPALKKLFATKTPVLILSCTGTGVMTAAVSNLFALGEKVLIVNAGKFAERWVEIASVHQLEIVDLAIPYGQAIAPEIVANLLKLNPDIKGVLIQLSETSTGVLHPVADIAKITSKSDVLLIVDGISSVSISPCYMDKWGIDCLLTGSQKGLMLPPGLGLIALSEKAWKKAANIPNSCYYFNLIKEKESLEKNQTLFTSPVSLILALAESMDMLMEAGLENVYAKQWALTMMARSGIEALGLELFAVKDFTWGLTSFLVPIGIDASLVLDLCASKHGVIMSSGQGSLKGRLIRMGHMGWVDWADILAALHALSMSINELGGYNACPDYLEKSLVAYHQGLETYADKCNDFKK